MRLYIQKYKEKLNWQKGQIGIDGEDNIQETGNWAI